MSRRPKRDFAALIGESAELLHAAEGETPHSLPITALTAGKGQPRQYFDHVSLQELAASIQVHGILQPLLVRAVEGGYEIVAGERRWRAAQLAGLSEIPVIVRELGDREARQLALIENLQRENLNTVEEVDAKLELVATTLGLSPHEVRTRLIQMLREAPGDDHMALESLFSALGERWQSFTRNKLKILNWPKDILDAVRTGLAYSVAQIIVPAPVEYHSHLIEFAQKGASKQEVKEEVKRLTATPVSHSQATRVGKLLISERWLNRLGPKEQKALDSWLAKMPDTLREALGD